MIPPIGIDKKIKKGTGLGRFGLTDVLKLNEQLRASAAPAK